MKGVTYRKVRFVSREHGATVGRILDDSHFPANIPAISRLYPMHEASKMRQFQQSPPFATWHEAFDYTFTGES